MVRERLLSIVAVAAVSCCGSWAAASVQIETMMRGVSSDLEQLEEKCDPSNNRISLGNRKSAAKGQSVYYYEMTHSLGPMSRGKLSYTLLGNTNEDSKASGIAKAGKSGARQHSSPAANSAFAFQGISQQLSNGLANGFPSRFNFAGLSNGGSQGNASSGSSAGGSGSFAPSGAGAGSAPGVPNTAAISGVPSVDGPQMMFDSGSVESSVRPSLANGVDDPTTVVPELSALVTWIMLSPLGAMALTGRRNRLTR